RLGTGTAAAGWEQAPPRQITPAGPRRPAPRRPSAGSRAPGSGRRTARGRCRAGAAASPGGREVVHVHRIRDDAEAERVVSMAAEIRGNPAVGPGRPKFWLSGSPHRPRPACAAPGAWRCGGEDDDVVVEEAPAFEVEDQGRRAAVDLVAAVREVDQQVLVAGAAVVGEAAGEVFGDRCGVEAADPGPGRHE